MTPNISVPKLAASNLELIFWEIYIMEKKVGVYAKDWGSRTFVSRNRLSLGF